MWGEREKKKIHGKLLTQKGSGNGGKKLGQNMETPVFKKAGKLISNQPIFFVRVINNWDLIEFTNKARQGQEYGWGRWKIVSEVEQNP